jgi:hypothetical protein
MKKAELLKILGAGMLIAAAAILWPACKSSSTTPTTTDSKEFFSTTIESHFHNLTVYKSDVTNPPAAGVTRETTSVNGHTHTFTMTHDELAMLNNGQVINHTTSDTNSHHHLFTISKWF